jgi:hypothetical protein
MDMGGPWHIIHNLRPHRVAANRDDAMKYLWLIDKMNYSPEALAYFHRVIPTERGERVEITNRKFAFMAFYKDGVRDVEANVWLEASPDNPQFAEEWTYAPTGEKVDLPETCENFCKPYLEAAPRAMHHCFGFGLGFMGRSTKGFAFFDELEGKSEAEIDAFWQRLYASDCFMVHFASGISVKPERVEGCPPGWDYSAYPLTLPYEHRRPCAEIVFSIPAGEGRVLTFPDWAAPHYAAYCPDNPPDDLSKHLWQGYVEKGLVEQQLAKGLWTYPVIVDSDPLKR